MAKYTYGDPSRDDRLTITDVFPCRPVGDGYYTTTGTDIPGTSVILVCQLSYQQWSRTTHIYCIFDKDKWMLLKSLGSGCYEESKLLKGDISPRPTYKNYQQFLEFMRNL
jgi:hypothetical protein